MYGPYMHRIEIRVSDEWLAKLDGLRGGSPRGTFLKGLVDREVVRRSGVLEAVVEPVKARPAASDPSPAESLKQFVAPARSFQKRVDPNALARQRRLNEGK